MLRKYQGEALDTIEAELKAGVTQQLLVMATGCGKTVVFSHLPSKLADILPGQTMVLAHREELIDQAVDKLRHWNPSLRIDKEMAEHFADPSADVIVSSVATLGRTGSKRIERFNWDNITKVVCDEAHHSTASTYMNVFQTAGVLNPENKKLLLGVTATPRRGDGQALAEVYQKIVYNYPMRSAIEDGWLVDVRGMRVKTRDSLDEIRTLHGDLAQNELATTVNNPVRNRLVVNAWLDNAANRQTVVFSVDIQHAQALAAAFEESGIKAAAVWGNDPLRADKLKAHRNRQLTVLVNCNVLTEGYDDWGIGCIVLAKPTKSSSLFTQMVGRGTRLEEGTGNLLEAINAGVNLQKTDCLVIDIVDNSSRHSLVTLPTLLGLNTDLDLKGKSALQSAKAIEEAQEANPHINFAELKDITGLKAFVENVNMFDTKWPVEVVGNSKLRWLPMQGGGYRLLLPDHEDLRIRKNLLDKYELSATINKQKFAGVRDSLESAFTAMDELVVGKVGPITMRSLLREEPWQEAVASDPQKRLLRKFTAGRKTKFCICHQSAGDRDTCTTCGANTGLTKGQAHRFVAAFLAGQMKGHQLFAEAK